MGRIGKYVKAVTERKRYQIDYTDWLDTGEGVSSVTFSIPANSLVNPIVVDGIQVLPTALGVQFYVSGGVDGETYNVFATLQTTTGPQTRLDDIVFVIREP